MKVLLLITAVFSLSFATLESVQQQNPSTDVSFSPAESWQEFATYDGVKVEYKKEVVVHAGRNASMVFFKITNTNSTAKTFNFTRAFYRDGECWNCERLDNPEYSFSLSLDANGVMEGSASNKENALMLFDRFTKLVPGMADDRLTNVVFSNVSVQ